MEFSARKQAWHVATERLLCWSLKLHSCPHTVWFYQGRPSWGTCSQVSSQQYLKDVEGLGSNVDLQSAAASCRHKLETFLDWVSTPVRWGQRMSMMWEPDVWLKLGATAKLCAHCPFKATDGWWMGKRVTLNTSRTVAFSDLKFRATCAKGKENRDLAEIKPPKVQLTSNKYFNTRRGETIWLWKLDSIMEKGWWNFYTFLYFVWGQNRAV